MKRKGSPERNELVVCEITRINPNSAFADLLEYEMSGMIHVSEVANRWVRDIREFVKPGQLTVCRVMRVEGGNLSLSIKRVNKDQADRKMQDYKKETRAEKFIEQIAGKKGITMEKAYEEVGYMLIEEFGSLWKAFEMALRNPELLETKGVEAWWRAELIDIASKNLTEKTYEMKSELKLVSYADNGMQEIKDALVKIEKHGLTVKYIAAGKYQVSGSGKNAKELKKNITEACEKAVEGVENNDGEGSFELLEE